VLLTRSKRLREVLGVVETANLLLVKLLVKNSAAARSYPGIVFRDYMSLVGDDGWKSRPVEDVLPPFGRARIVIERVHDSGAGTAPTPLDELAALALLTRVLEPKRIFEIGTFRGRTAVTFALNCPPDCRVHTLDLPAGATIARDVYAVDREFINAGPPGSGISGGMHKIEQVYEYADTDVAHKIEQLYGDSATFDFAPFDDSVDIVFVDGAHHYAAVRSDTENALRMVRPGGVVIWHDFANYGDYNDVIRAVFDTVPRQHVIQLGSTELALYRTPAK